MIVSLLGVVVLALAVLIALVAVVLLVTPALVALRVLLLWGLSGWLALLLRLIHRVQDTKVMFRVLEEGFSGNPISAAGRVAAELEVFLEKLLGGTADTDVRPIAVKNVVAIERNATARIMANGAAAAGSTTTATTTA